MLFAAIRKFELFYYLTARIVHYYQLVRNYSVNDALFFVLTHGVDRAGAMQLRLASTFAFRAVKNFVNILRFTAAFKLIHTRSPPKPAACFHFRGFGMIATVTHLSYWVELLTSLAPN